MSHMSLEGSFIHKCTQLWETIMVRHGLMVVGMNVSGKTEAKKWRFDLISIHFSCFFVGFHCLFIVFFFFFVFFFSLLISHSFSAFIFHQSQYHGAKCRWRTSSRPHWLLLRMARHPERSTVRTRLRFYEGIYIIIYYRRLM